MSTAYMVVFKLKYLAKANDVLTKSHPNHIYETAIKPAQRKQRS